MPVVHAWTGGVTDRSVRVIARVTGTSARLAASTRPDFTDPVWSAPATPDATGLVDITLDVLPAATRHYWAIETRDGQADPVLDTTTTGAFTTHPRRSSAANFTIAVSSCAGLDPATPGVGDVLAGHRLSNHRVFGDIAAATPLMLIHIGDLHYYDPSSGQHGIPDLGPVIFDRAFDDVLAQPRQHDLYRTVPTVYVWDDHDYGRNNSDSTSPLRSAAQAAYRRRIPSYPLPDSAGIYQSWQTGRVLCVALDSRSYRDPNTTPDGPTKTMLGATQKGWLRTLLSTSDAAALVLFSPSVWHHPTGGADTWASFRHEQDELVDMFTTTGWSDRMVIVAGDTHSAGISTGAGAPGGIPILQAASLDSTPGPRHPHLDVGSWPGRGQYGLINVTDTGTQIRIRLSAHRGDRELGAHPVTITDRVDEPAPVLPPPPTQARQHSDLTWVACEAVGGRLIADLPEVDGKLPRLLGAYSTTSLTIPLPRSGPAKLPDVLVDRATSPGRTLMVAIAHGRPTWAGLVVARSGGTAPALQVSCVTPEGYLDRRRVRDHRFERVDQAQIAAALLADAEAGTIGDRRIGTGLGLVVDAPVSGTRRDRSYYATDRKTVYAALQELMGVQGGPEWTIDPMWSDETETGISLVARVRNRIGRDQPDIMFAPTAGSPFVNAGDLAYDHTLDHSDGKGGNWVVAYSSGQGEDQPQSRPAVDEHQLAAGYPIFERVWQPSSSITSIDTLNAHATAELARIAGGSATWKLTTRLDAWPRYGIDWGLGDTLSWRAIGHLHPYGHTDTGRVIGVDLDAEAGTCQPILLEPEGSV